MTRLYLKIFFGFWLVTILMMVGSNLVIHWLDMTPNEYLTQHQPPRHDKPARRLLHRIVGSAINSTRPQVIEGMQHLPRWAQERVYILDLNNNDLLERKLPDGFTLFVPKLTYVRPFGQMLYKERQYYGRVINLADGEPVKIVTVSTPENRHDNIVWQLFINNIWPLLLVSIVISGTACLLLARRLASGISTLKQATQQIAKGDLSVRVGPHFENRVDEIGDLGRDFDHMTERLEKAMLEQKRLIKDVSHELRSPLARLQFALGIAMQRSQDNDINKELERIKDSADYLNDIISDILSMPIHDSGEWELTDAIDLHLLLQTLMDDYQRQAQEKSMSIEYHSDIDEALIATRGNTLLGVFENILRNALHYNQCECAVTIKLQTLTDHFRISISDHGPGVDSDALDDIFQPFFRTDEARTRSSGGYGLGLAIAQRTVALHRGRISAYNNASPESSLQDLSVPDSGLTIVVELPHGDSPSPLS